MNEGKKIVYQVLVEGFTANEGPSLRVEPTTRSHEAKKVLADASGVYFTTPKDAFDARRRLRSMRGGWGEAIVVKRELVTLEEPDPVEREFMTPGTGGAGPVSDRPVFSDAVKGYTPGAGA